MALVLCVGLFGCEGKQTDAAMYMKDGGSVSVNFMYLLAAVQKSMYASVAEANGGDWDTVVNYEKGTTLANLLEDVTYKAAQSSLICEYLHDTVYGLTLSDTQKKAIDEQMDSLVSKAGSKQKLEEQLSAYSADTKAMRRYLELTVKQVALYSYFYGEGGIYAISEDAVRDSFKENYHIVTHIYFDLSAKRKEDGTSVSLTNEEKAEKRALAEEVYNRILAGEDFYTLKEAYSEDAYESEYYPNGFFVTGDTTFPTEFTMAAIEMEVGEYRLTVSDESANGIHILYKLPMDESLYNTNSSVYSTIKEKLITADFDTRLAEYADAVAVNEEEMAKVNVRIVPEYAY